MQTKPHGHLLSLYRDLIQTKLVFVPIQPFEKTPMISCTRDVEETSDVKKALP
jgi:hypothetical protein